MPRLKLRTIHYVVLGVLGVGILVALLIQHLANPRIIARVVTPDGYDLCLLQRPNWGWGSGGDPFFTTTFAFLKPGTNWQTFYYNHEDSYWGGGRVELDTNAHIARFYRGRALSVTFAWRSETYTLHRNRPSPSSPWQMPPGWRPENQHR